MTAEEKYVIHLLRTGIGIESDYELEPVSTTKLVSIIASNGVMLTVYHYLPESIKEILRNSYYVLARQHILQEYEGERILNELSAAGLNCIALKGWELRKLYPESSIRQMTDLDILVKPYDYDRIMQVMTGLNYKRRSLSGNEGSWKHDDFVKNVVLIEMHKRLTDDSDMIQAWENEMWSRAVRVRDNVFEMEPEDYYVFHFVHLHKDFLNGSLGLRRIADTWLLDRRGGVNMQTVRSILESFGMWTFHERMIKLAKATMGETEMDEGSEFLLSHAFTHGIYGSETSYKAGRIAAMGNTLKGGKRRSALAAVFLPYSRMKAQFPILKKCPILLPYCWLKRIVRFLNGNLKEKKKMLDYSEIGTDEFNEMKKFFEYGGVR